MRWVLAVAACCLWWRSCAGRAPATRAPSSTSSALLQQSLFLATPLILGAMAGILCERTGVINVAIEGQMLAGRVRGRARSARVAHNLGVG